MSAQSYTPATYTSGSVQPTTVTAPPLTPAPQPLPTSQNYVRPQKQKSGFMNSIKGTWEKFTEKAQRSWNESTDERFRRYFGFPFTELLFGEFWGELWTNNQLVNCSVYLSSNWLCVLAKVRDPANSHNKFPLRVQIALRDIIRIQRAVTLPSMRGGAPIIQAITDPSVRADSLQVFTRDGMLHQFTKFYNYERMLATLEHLWHQATYSAQPGYQPSISTAAPNTTPLAYPQPPVQTQQPALLQKLPATEAHLQQPMAQAGTAPYQQSTSPYQQQSTTSYQQQSTSPYQQPYQQQTSTYQPTAFPT